ncbi:uncharacterized protein K489DRAFT_413822 [Dissoconium aciculare CBS 342.82]|uniref:Rhodopsin domain-containing protein n=1 Tax=Dissoconium aciculare CBS 342.82 TaxID=1314786 RepID=A0A6J3LR88_9PEZI|nr:uncharacterized protein K489DRAFT_413822 [Dissoconium aciculare CBS 342.82]KAF1818350.1 hypothetical protein K489DRAFT_413822 [Dissoconium aciculare CBS 342.82]
MGAFLPPQSLRRDLIYGVVEDEHDPSGLVRIVVVLCMIFAWLVMAARIEMRRPLGKLFGLDDWAALFATVLSLAQQIVVMLDLPTSLAKKPDLQAAVLESVGKMTYTSDLLYIITLFAAKIAVATLFLRFVASQREHALVVTLLIAGLVLALPAFILVAAQELPLKPRIESLQSARQAMFRHWTAVELLGIIYEIALISYPIYLSLKCSGKRLTRFRTIFFALLRLPIIALAILRIVSLGLALQDSPAVDIPSQHATTEVIMQVLLTYSVICASLICLAFHPSTLEILPTTTTTSSSTTTTTSTTPCLPSSSLGGDTALPSYDRSPKRPSYFSFRRKKSTPDRPSAMHALQMSLSCDQAWTVTRAERSNYGLLHSSGGGASSKKGSGKDIVVVSTVEVKFEEGTEEMTRGKTKTGLMAEREFD